MFGDMGGLLRFSAGKRGELMVFCGEVVVIFAV